jgi:hypothetical protein
MQQGSNTGWGRAAWMLVAVQLAIAAPQSVWAAGPSQEPDPSWAEPDDEMPTFGNVDAAEQQPIEEVTPPSATPAIPDASWTSMIGKRVEVTLGTGEVLTGQLAQDNGGSVTIIDDTQTVRVVSKAQATMLRPLDTAAATPAALPGTAPVAATPGMVPMAPDGMTRDQKVNWELTQGTLASQYRKGKGLVLGGATFTILGTVLLIPGAILRAKGSASKSLTTILLASGGVIVGSGIILLAAGVARTGKVRRQAEAKHPVTAAPAMLGRRAGGLVMSGRF